MKTNISFDKFIKIVEDLYGMDCIHLLYYLQEGHDIRKASRKSKKVEALYNTLVRKGLITERTRELSPFGKEILEFVDSQDVEKPLEKPLKPQLFEMWWDAYPRRTEFSYKGIHFEGGDRSLRIKKAECKSKFENILRSKKYTFEEMMQALKIQLTKVKIRSISTGQNKLEFFVASDRYLNNGIYENYIPKPGEKIVTEEEDDNGEIGKPIDI
jgi:hypothetical protein